MLTRRFGLDQGVAFGPLQEAFLDEAGDGGPHAGNVEPKFLTQGAGRERLGVARVHVVFDLVFDAHSLCPFLTRFMVFANFVRLMN